MKKKKVLIYYEHLTREYKSVQMMKKEFEAKGCTVKCYQIHFQRYKSFVSNHTNNVDIIVLPWLYNELSEYVYYYVIKNNPDAVVINLHSEQLNPPVVNDALLPSTPYSKHGCYHFTWGEYFRNQLIEKGVEKNTIYVTGSIRNDEVKSTNVTREGLAQRYNLDLNKRWVLFAETCGVFTRYNQDDIERIVRSGYTREMVEDRIRYESYALESFKKDVMKLNSDVKERFEIIYRPHPGINAKEEDYPGIHVIGEGSIYEWLLNCDLILTRFSTTIFEAEICGKLCASYKFDELPPICQQIGVGEYYKINDLNELSDDTLNNIQRHRTVHSNIYLNYYGKIDGCAVKRVVDTALKLKPIKNGIIPDKYNENTKSFIKGLAFEIVAYVFEKIGIVSKLHIPRGAVTYHTDMPYSRENDWIKRYQ